MPVVKNIILQPAAASNKTNDCKTEGNMLIMEKVNLCGDDFMDENQSLLEVKVIDGDVYLSKFLSDKILDEIQINSIGKQVISLIDNNARKVVLDFGNVDYLSSSALGMLITIKKRLDSVGGELKLCNINKQIFQVFELTKLDKLFSIYDTSSQALAGFNE